MSLDEAQNVLKQAVVFLEQAMGRSSVQLVPDRLVVEGFGGTWMVVGEGGGIVADEVIHGGDADLIALMYNVLPEQVALLKAAMEVNDLGDPVFMAAVRVAEAIVG